jgi:hypothetical protein
VFTEEATKNAKKTKTHEEYLGGNRGAQRRPSRLMDDPQDVFDVDQPVFVFPRMLREASCFSCPSWFLLTAKPA